MLLEPATVRPLQRRVRQALPAEVLCGIANFEWRGSPPTSRAASSVPQNGLLRDTIPERLFAVQHL